MKPTFLYHSGFLIETKECYYLFDYYQGELPVLDADKPVIVFASHGHADHYNPAVFPLLEARGLRDITAVVTTDIPKKRYPDSPAVTVRRIYHSQEYDLPCHTHIKTLLSTDAGVAYLLTCPEGTLYHAGDLNDWNHADTPAQERKQMTGSFQASVNRLKGSPIDIAFLPLDPRLEETYADGFLYFLKTISVKKVYPMHYWGQSGIVERFLRDHPEYKGIVFSPETLRQ